MESRRQFLTVVATTLGLAPVVAWLGSPTAANRGNTTAAEPLSPVRKTGAEWRSALTPEQFRVLRGHGTDRAGSSPLNREKRRGVFACAGCGRQLFSSDAKFESGTGWPSFFEPLGDAVGTRVDRACSWCAPKCTAWGAAGTSVTSLTTARGRRGCGTA